MSQNKTWTFIKIVLFSLLALGLASIFAFFLYVKDVENKINMENTLQKSELRQKAMETIKKLAENAPQAYWIGSKNPQVTIVEFSDFACPYCKQSAPIIKSLLQMYPDTIKFIFRDNPLHENSLSLAMAARCAGEQGQFWAIHDKFFNEQGSLTTDDAINKSVLNLPIDRIRYQNCFGSKKYLSGIQADFSDAETLDIQGTPTWFANGYKVEGVVPLETWKAIIEKLIKQNEDNKQ